MTNYLKIPIEVLIEEELKKKESKKNSDRFLELEIEKPTWYHEKEKLEEKPIHIIIQM